MTEVESDRAVERFARSSAKILDHLCSIPSLDFYTFTKSLLTQLPNDALQVLTVRVERRLFALLFTHLEHTVNQHHSRRDCLSHMRRMILRTDTARRASWYSLIFTHSVHFTHSLALAYLPSRSTLDHDCLCL